jgi:hypothetical protein
MTSRRSGVRWGRIVFAAVLTEIITVMVLVVIVFLYGLGSPGSDTGVPDQEQMNEFTRATGIWIGPVLGSILTFIFALWAGRGMADGFILQGALVGLVVTLLDVVLLLGMADDFTAAFIVWTGLKILAGALGGLAAGRTFARHERPLARGA